MHLPIVWVGKKDVGMERPSMHVLGAVKEKGIGAKKKESKSVGQKQQTHADTIRIRIGCFAPRPSWIREFEISPKANERSERAE